MSPDSGGANAAFPALMSCGPPEGLCAIANANRRTWSVSDVSRTFIVLEKDDDLRSLYRRKLEQKFRDCIVLEASSCSEAHEILGYADVDAIIVNQAALDARGVEMVRSIRRVHVDVPLVSIGDPPQADLVLSNGADIFVETQRWQELGSAVEQVLAQRSERN